MNERIKKLELEAIAYADSKVSVNDRYNDIYHNIVRHMTPEQAATMWKILVDKGIV
jgi:hypothetical protein